MKRRKFTANKPPPVTAGIPKVKTLSKARQSENGVVMKAHRGMLHPVYAARGWRHRALAASVIDTELGQRWECYLCGKFMILRETTIDHVSPVSKGGTNRISNCKPCCFKCNNEKADQMP
jgi:5-methylcytosine-specific restriction endonuclease McrA